MQSSAFAVINLHVLEADRNYASAGLLCKQGTAKVTVMHSPEGLAQWWSSIALRENRSNSQLSGQPALHAFPSFCSLTSSLFLSALFFPSYLSFSFLLCSSAQIRLWPSQWRVRLWDLRAERRPENPFRFKSELNKMGELSWLTSSSLCLLLIENLPLLGPRNWFLLLLKGAKYKLIFVQCIVSGTAEELIQRRSFSCCF